MPASRQIVTGEDYTADDINNLRSDVLDGSTGHNHDGTDGRKVGFSDLDITGALGSTAPSGGSTSYDDVDDHVQSDQGVHGLNGAVYVLGSDAANIMVQSAKDTTSLAQGEREEVDISFVPAFGSVPVVVATLHGSSDNMAPKHNNVAVRNVTTSGATVYIQSDDVSNAGMDGFYWIAIGPGPT